MINIPLQAIPNQSFQVQLDGLNFSISIFSSNNIMAVDIVRDNIPIVTGQRAVVGTPLIPYGYLVDGNFVFTTMNEDYPDYTQFGVSQFLIYASQSELEALNGTSS